MTDLTKITTAFGLLDEATQKALRAHKGPIEYYGGGGWTQIHKPLWTIYCVYRAKVEPKKPREWFVLVGDDGSLQAIGDNIAELARRCPSSIFGWVNAHTVKVREVIE